MFGKFCGIAHSVVVGHDFVQKAVKAVKGGVVDQLLTESGSIWL